MRENRWLLDWLDELDLTTLDQAEKALKDPAHWARLIQMAQDQLREPEVTNLGKRSIVAGRSLDLTAFLACGHPTV